MSAISTLERDLSAGRPVLLDGATGTELERRGAPMHEGAWCAMATLTSPEILRGVHEDYIRAGARVIAANTFSTNRLMLEPAGLADRFETLNRAAVAIALEARERAGAGDRVVVAGSMSHQLPLAAGGDQRSGEGLPSPGTARDCFEEMAGLLADAGVDLIVLEMMSDPDLVNPAIAAALATGLPVWVGLSLRGGEDGRPVSYSLPHLSMEAMLDGIGLDGVAAAGIMHTSIHLTDPALAALRERWSGPLTAYPDSGYFQMPSWQFVDVIPPERFAEVGRRWVDAGVGVVGGCCGLGVDHIAALAAAVDFG